MTVDLLALHAGPEPLLLGGAWDVGSAKALAFLGFRALATTSSGHAAALGRNDGEVTRDEALAHVATLAGATGLPVNADLGGRGGRTRGWTRAHRAGGEPHP